MQNLIKDLKELSKISLAHEFVDGVNESIALINDHKCVWKRRIDSTADKSIRLSVWKPSCSENSYIDNSGQFCRDCAGRVEIAD